MLLFSILWLSQLLLVASFGLLPSPTHHSVAFLSTLKQPLPITDILLESHHNHGISFSEAVSSPSSHNFLLVAVNEWTNAALPSGMGPQVMDGLGSLGNMLGAVAIGFVVLILLSPLLFWGLSQLAFQFVGAQFPEISKKFKQEMAKVEEETKEVEERLKKMEDPEDVDDDEAFEVIMKKGFCFYEHWLLPVVQQIEPELYEEYEERLEPGESFVTNLELGIPLCVKAFGIEIDKKFIDPLRVAIRDDEDLKDEDREMLMRIVKALWEDRESEPNSKAYASNVTNEANEPDVIQKMRKELEKEGKSSG